jgi:cell wall-associated NlpC family hydrolase
VGAVLLPGEVCEAGDVLTAERWHERFPDGRAALVATALHVYEGTSYQWGGVTPWGADCSGFAQGVFALHGVPLPRDAWQQALEGEDAGDDPLALQPADLLFFSDRADGRITHVGIAVGGGRMAHLSLGRGGFGVDRLDREGDPYVARLRETFRLARRMPVRG